jgi:hypothetical protein
MLLIGGAKGSGLSLMFECLTSILAGTPIIAALSGETGDKAVSQNATIDPDSCHSAPRESSLGESERKRWRDSMMCNFSFPNFPIQLRVCSRC